MYGGTGDVSALKLAEAALTPSGGSPGEPVVVIADSGGAAEDLYNYSTSGRWDEDRRSAEYNREARELLW